MDPLCTLDNVFVVIDDEDEDEDMDEGVTVELVAVAGLVRL